MTSLLAAVNVAQLRHPLEDERMAGLVDGIGIINRMAESSPGFVWRGTGAAGHSALLSTGSGQLFVNVSLWTTYAQFHEFTYTGAHGRYLTARARWFVPVPGATTALWWTSAKRRPPTVDEALLRLKVLRSDGPSSRAFSVLRQWDADGHPIRRTRAGRSPADR